MARIAAWRIEGNVPKPISQSSVDLERSLEAWIERDPSLLQEGLRIVGRQISLEGGRLDLLAVNPQGQWVLIELKAGKLYREVLAQSLDYAASISALSTDELRDKVAKYLNALGDDDLRQSVEDLLSQEAERSDEDRQVLIIISGSTTDPGLERIADYVASQYGLPLRVVTFEVFDLGSEKKILVREITESEEAPPLRRRLSLEENLAEADQQGIGPLVKRLFEGAQRNGLGFKLFKSAIMFTPASNRNRILFTVRTRARGGRVQVWPAPEPFAEFFPVVQIEEVEKYLGETPTEWRLLDTEGVDHFVQALDRLMAEVERRRHSSSGS